MRDFARKGCMAPTAFAGGGAPASSAPTWSISMIESVLRQYPVLSPRWDYTSGLMLTGVELVWSRTKDPKYLAYIKANIDMLVDARGGIETYRLEEFNLDQINEGKALFSLYRQTGDERYVKALHLLREQLRRQPRTSEGGFWHKRIYPHQMWLDGIYMASPYYARFAAEFNEPEGFDDVVKQITLIYERTKDPRTGLLYHGWDESRTQIWANSETGCSPNFWGRAVGWYVMALVDVLDYLPADHPGRKRVEGILAGTLAAVAAVVDERTGLWYQVLDQGHRAGNYLEASASCMFVYALAKGVSRGYLDEGFLAVARKGFQGILGNMIEVGERGEVHLKQVCQVAGLGGRDNRDGSYEYYTSEPVVMDDYKGLGAFILAAAEMEASSG